MFVCILVTQQADVCVCAGIPVSQRASLGLDDAEVPERRVPAWVRLSMAKHLDGHRPLRQVLNEVLCHSHSQLLERGGGRKSQYAFV